LQRTTIQIFLEVLVDLHKGSLLERHLLDRAGNVNTSETRIFTILNTPPVVVLQTIDNYMTNSPKWIYIILPMIIEMFRKRIIC